MLPIMSALTLKTDINRKQENLTSAYNWKSHQRTLVKHKRHPYEGVSEQPADNSTLCTIRNIAQSGDSTTSICSSTDGKKKT